VSDDISSMLAAVVVVFHPGDELVGNILSYLNKVDKVYVYKNSVIKPTLAKSLADMGGKVIVVGDEHNTGIAKALNEGCEAACRDGYEFLLTMDQDSSFDSFYVDFSGNLDEDVGLLYPVYQLESVESRSRPPWVMTSGNIVSLSAWRHVGGFDSSLFIDGVDFEFCMRLMCSGFSVLEDDTAKLQHQLGDSLEFKAFLFIRYRVANHSPIRQYYIFRNYSRIVFRYLFRQPRWSFFLLWVLFVRFYKLFLFEQRDSSLFKMAMRGVWDASLQISGPFQPSKK